MYKKLSEASHLHFSNCHGCVENCCDGSKFVLAPLILEDFKEVYQNFLIAFAFIEGRLRALMLISNRFKPCLYYKNDQCTIYEKRPPACVVYPYTPFYDEIMIDSSCQAVGSLGEKMVQEASCVTKQMLPQFQHERLDDFCDKLADTDIFLERLGYEFRPIFEIEGVTLLEYTGSQQNSFIQMHKASLEFLIEWRG